MTVAVTGLLLAACGNPDAGDPTVSVVERDSAGITVVEILADPRAVPRARLKETELVISGEAPPYFGRLGDARWLADGTIAVADRQADRVFVFGQDGRLLRTLGRSGSGPGEFTNIRGLYPKGDSLLVHDLGQDRLTLFAPHGRVVRTVPLPKTVTENEYERYYAMAPVAGGGMVGYRLHNDYGQEVELAPYARLLRNQAIISRHDGSGTPIPGPEIRFPGSKSVAMTPGGGRFMDIGVPFAGRPLVDVTPHRVVYGHGDRYQYTLAGPDLRPRRVVRWPTAAQPLTQEEVERLRSLQDSIWSPYMSRETVRDIHAVLFGPELLPEARPALQELRADPIGRVWAGRWEASDDTAPLFFVHDPAGQPLFSVRLPVGSELADVSRDRVLLITRDSLDVESLVIRRVAAPATTPEPGSATDG